MKSFDLNHILSTHFNSLSLSALFLMQEWVSASKNLQLLQSALKQVRQDKTQELHDKGSLAVDNLCFYYHILVKTATTGKEKLLAHLSELKDAVWKMQSELRMQKIFSCHPLDHALHLCGFAEKKLLAF